MVADSRTAEMLCLEIYRYNSHPVQKAHVRVCMGQEHLSFLLLVSKFVMLITLLHIYIYIYKTSLTIQAFKSAYSHDAIMLVAMVTSTSI